MLLPTLHSELEAEIHVGSVWVSVAPSPGLPIAKVAGSGNPPSSHLLILCWAPQPGLFPPGTQQDLAGSREQPVKKGLPEQEGGLLIIGHLGVARPWTLVIFIYPQEHDLLEPEKRVAESIRGRWSE